MDAVLVAGVLVDEAGMVPTRQLARLIDAAPAVRGKLVLVGDHRQLPNSKPAAPFADWSTVAYLACHCGPRR